MARSETCSRCGEEIRFGTREPVSSPRWLHAAEADHEVLHGQPYTAAMQVETERQRHLPRFREDKDGNVIQYTTAEWERSKYSKAKRDQLDEAELGDDIEVEPLPEPEVRARDIEVSEFAPRSGIRQVYNVVDRTPGWSIINLHYARGPRTGAQGQLLGISDSVVLRAKQDRALDGTVRVAVASWLDGAFNIAWIGTIGSDNVLRPNLANSTEMKDWIKG